MAIKKKQTLKKTAPKKKITTKKKILSKKKRPVSKKKTPVKAKKTTKRTKSEKIIGVVTHYFPKVRAAVIKLKAPLSVGDTIKIKGHTTDFTQTISSMQIDHVSVSQAKKGQEIGLLVNSRARQHDIMIKA